MQIKNQLRRHPVSYYFLFTFCISWIGAFLLVAAKLFNHQPISKLDGLLMFPVMLIGPFTSGIIFTLLLQGRAGIRKLLHSISTWKVSFRWYLMTVLIPPSLILVTLFCLRFYLSPVFSPNLFWLGFLFGIPAGFFEEIGWTGFAFPNMYASMGFPRAAITLGFLWGLWHLPVIDFLGAASPHGKFIWLFGLSFILAMSAMRIIISWIYLHTKSVGFAQLMHVISTGSLVVLGPFGVTPSQEALWYGCYAVLLWLIALWILIAFPDKKNASLKI